MDIWAKYTKTVGRGVAWNTDDGVTYHVCDRGGGTLCARGRPYRPKFGTVTSNGWELLRGRSKLYVNCSWCLRKLNKKGSI